MITKTKTKNKETANAFHGYFTYFNEKLIRVLPLTVGLLSLNPTVLLHE